MAATSDIQTYEQTITELRHYYFEHADSLKVVDNTLPSLIDRLRVSHQEGQAKRVLGQALHLSSLLSCHRMDYGTCLQETREIIEYANACNDVDMEAAALIQQGMLCYYQILPRQRHAVFGRAMELIQHIQSPLLRMRVLFGYAESMAVIGQVDAERCLERAESLSVSSDDPGRVFVRHTHVTQAIHRARFFVARSELGTAVELLAGVYSRGATPENVEVLSILAQAYSHMILRREEDAFENACFFVEALVDAATRMNSILHISHAQICYEFLMLSKMHREFSKRLLPVVAF